MSRKSNKEYSLFGLKFNGNPAPKARGAVYALLMIVIAAIVFKGIGLVKKWTGKGDGKDIELFSEEEARDSLITWLKADFDAEVTGYSLMEAMPMNGVGNFTSPDYSTLMKWYELYQELDDLSKGSRTRIEFEKDKAMKERGEADSLGRELIDEKIKMLQMMMVDRTRRRAEISDRLETISYALDSMEKEVDGVLMRAKVEFSDSVFTIVDYVMDDLKRLALLRIAPDTLAVDGAEVDNPVEENIINH